MHDGHANRVLLVEKPDGGDMLKLGLEMAGYQVDVANNCDTCLLIAAARAPVAAIIDLDLPPANGGILARSLRQMSGPPIQLIAITSQTDPADQDRSWATGFDLYLVKPVSPNRVHQTLRRLIPH